MHRFLVTPDALNSDAVPLGPTDSHHAAVVLRLRPGDAIELLDGQGTVASARVEAVGRDAVLARVVARRRFPPPSPGVVLVAALLKGKAWDWTLQKCTEAGVSSIIPVMARRSVVRIHAGEAARRREEWARTMGEAAKQCGGAWLPGIVDPVDLGSWLRPLGRGEIGMVASLEGRRRTILESTASAGDVQRAWVAVGPEGDWDESELRLFREAGYLDVTLGDHVLRAETAALAAVVLAKAGLARPTS